MKIRQLPTSIRVTLAVMYAAGIGLILAAMTISLLQNFVIGYWTGLLIETVLITYLWRQR